MKRDFFTSGISSNFIKERLLEARILNFTAAYEKARDLKLAKVNCEMYSRQQISSERIYVIRKKTTEETNKETSSSFSSSKIGQTFECYFCRGNRWHSRNRCSAKTKLLIFAKKLDIMRNVV